MTYDTNKTQIFTSTKGNFKTFSASIAKNMNFSLDAFYRANDNGYDSILYSFENFQQWKWATNLISILYMSSEFPD